MSIADNPKLQELEKQMTAKQVMFCREYVVDWNGTRSAITAGYSENTARAISSENLAKPYIQDYIKEIQKHLAELAGVSALRNMQELAKIAYSSIAETRKDWMTLKEFDELGSNEKASISEILTITREGKDGKPIQIVKFKLHPKIQAIEVLNKMNGWNAPDQIEQKITEHHSYVLPDGSEIKI